MSNHTSPSVLVTGLLCVLAAAPVGAAAAPDYERDIKPLFRERCVSCHGQIAQKGGLRLDAAALAVKGGKHGAAVTPGSSDKSELIKRLISMDEEHRMPQEAKPLPPDKIDLVRRWIDAGAPFPKDEPVPGAPAAHWSFQPVRRPVVPPVKDSKTGRNPIDLFVEARNETRGVKPLPQASRKALLRRIYLDLTGLPPPLDVQQLAETQAIDTAVWLDALVDRLLASPQYGERWARHWLDVVRYADSNGYERDAEKPMVWRYRDYVVDALNQDKPFDRQVLEQIAGDELPDRTDASTIATGFLRLGHWDDEPADPLADRYDQLDDIVSTTSQAFLGLTLGCARCHDHKFEPLSTRDYYSLVAVFNPLERPRKGRVELAVPVVKGDAYVWKESSARTPETHVLLRGSPTRHGERVAPAVPAILVKSQPLFPAADDRSTRRRLGFAQWLAGADNPLTARVMVNRIWQQHFGRGLVATASDFGLMGEAPADPALLDWLTHWFTHEAGWSLKRLHRLILTSSTWRQIKGSDTAFVTPLYRRLEVEAIRDSMLAVSGQLNNRQFGPGMKPPIPAAALEANTDKASVWKPSSVEEASRRTVYAFVKRGLVLPMLEVLDLADTVASCSQRQITTVAPQALSLFNGEFVNQQAAAFASRLRREAGTAPAAQIRHGWRLALCRDPGARELAGMLEFLQHESLEQACRVILNLNEFAYPE